MKLRLRYILTFLMLASFAMVSARGTVKLRVESPVGGNEIEIGEKFYIYYTIVNNNGDPSRPGTLPGCNILSFNFSSSSSSIVSTNGHTEQSSTRTYVLYARAKSEGKFTFGPVVVDGVKSNTVSYSIVSRRKSSSTGPGSPSAPSSRQRSTSADSQDDSSGPTFIGKGDDKLFLRAIVNKSTAYEQEALEYTVKLYTTYSRIKFIGATEAPKFDGFVVEDTKKTSNQLSYESYGGKTYATAVIARYVIFPQMKGKLKVTGNTYTISADRSEFYSDDFFSHMTVYQPIQLNVTPNDLYVDVKPLPTPQPADFSGGVGQFTISSSLPASSLFTNNAASVVYTVKGTGNLKYIKLPDLNNIFPKELEVYSPSTDVKTEVGTSNVSGQVKFDYSFMPLETGDYKIPQVTLVYFNPNTAQYERAVAKGYNVSVAEGKGSGKSQTMDKLVFNPKMMADEGGISKVHFPYVYQFAYWLWYLLPSLALVGVTIYYRRRLKLLSDMTAFRSRKAGKVAAKRLRKAAACMNKGRDERFYDEMLLALWGYLGDKLKMPTSALNRDNVRNELMQKGISPQLSDDLVKVIDECEFAKYSSQKGAESMKSVYDMGAGVINSLESAFSKSAGSKNADDLSKLEY